MTTEKTKPKIHNVEDHPDDETMKFCTNCQNSGSVNCYCGGDQCFCENQGEIYCPYCEAGEEWQP